MPRSSNETSGARCGSPSVSRASLGLPITAPRVCGRPRPICGGFASTDGFSIGDLSTGGFSTGGFSTGGVSTGGVSTGSDAVRQRGALGFSSGGIWTGGTRTLPPAAVQMVDTAGADGDDCPFLASKSSVSRLTPPLTLSAGGSSVTASCADSSWCRSSPRSPAALARLTDYYQWCLGARVSTYIRLYYIRDRGQNHFRKSSFI